MIVRLVKKEDFSCYLKMRMDLWPHCPLEEHIKEMNEFQEDLEHYPVFVAIHNEEVVGFIEASIHTYAPGCHSTPVGFIEGWYVAAAYRKHGVGKKLVDAVEKWSLSKGFKEVASDAEEDNLVSITAHQHLGYKIVGYIDGEVKFIKEINLQEVFCNRRVSTIQYKNRQCAYGIILNGEHKIALVKLTKGNYMPGGGMERLENFEECIKRELLEEIGYDCVVADFICKSKEYYYATHTRDFRVSEGYFYQVQLKDKVMEPIEKNHQLIWMDIEEAIYSLVPLFQKEALKYFNKVKKMVKSYKNC